MVCLMYFRNVAVDTDILRFIGRSSGQSESSDRETRAEDKRAGGREVSQTHGCVMSQNGRDVLPVIKCQFSFDKQS